MIITKEIYGQHHGHVAASYSNLGNVYRDLGQYSQAKYYYERASMIRKKILSEQQNETVRTFRTVNTKEREQNGPIRSLICRIV